MNERSAANHRGSDQAETVFDEAGTWIRNTHDVPLEVCFDLQGDRVFLVPGLRYFLVVPESRPSQLDVVLEWTGHSLSVIGSSPTQIMRLFRQDGALVWSDGQVWGQPPAPESPQCTLKSLGVQTLLRRLPAHLDKKHCFDDAAGRDLLLLIEQGLAGLDQSGKVSLSDQGRAFLTARAPS